MKKTAKTPVLAIALALFAACDKETYRHSIAVEGSSVRFVYADQPADTVTFTTFDSYSASSSAAWITVDGAYAQATIPNSYYYITEVDMPVLLSPNTTGETRQGMVSIYNYGDDNWAQTVEVAYYQYGWPEITRPTPSYGYQGSASYPITATFELTDTAAQTMDSLVFNARADWTLQHSADFLSAELTSGQAGKHTVRLTLLENDSADQREADILLTSGGVATTIKLTQQGTTDKEDEI